jgi:hypothetical protein
MHAALRVAASKLLQPTLSRNRRRSTHSSSSPLSTRAMATPEQCCGASAAAPVKLDYTPMGKTEKLPGGADCCESGDRRASAAASAADATPSPR